MVGDPPLDVRSLARKELTWTASVCVDFDQLASHTVAISSSDADRVADVLGQRGEQIELPGRQLDRLARNGCPPARRDRGATSPTVVPAEARSRCRRMRTFKTASEKGLVT